MTNIERYFDDLERDIRGNPDVASLKSRSQTRDGGGAVEIRVYEVYVKSDSDIESVEDDLDRLQVDTIRDVDEKSNKITIKDSFDKDLH